MSEPWQVVLTIVGVLGLSPAPWIVALLTGKLKTSSEHNNRIRDKNDETARIEARHLETVARILEERDNERDRAATEQARANLERDRADAASVKLVEVALELGQTTVRLLDSLPKPGANK